MLTKSRITLATALATVALGTPPALATPSEPADFRGEHAASLSDRPAVSDSPAGDHRTPDAVEPFVRPVVVEIDEAVPAGFDWTAAIIGMGAGLALAVLAGVGVAGGRRRHARPSTV
jgi:hypothetical protein